MTLDLVIPAHNEAEVILPTLALVSKALTHIQGLTWRIIVAENGSSDDTFAVVKNAAIPNVEIFSAKQTGKGRAIKEALAHSNADYVGWIDADCSASPDAIEAMLTHLMAGGVNIVIGSRFHAQSIVDRGWYRRSTSRLFNYFARLIVGVHVDDTQCPLKIMDKRAKALLLTCTENTWFLDLELLARAEHHGLGITTIPVIWEEFRYPLRKSKLSVVKDGTHAIATMIQLQRRLRRSGA